MVADLQEDLSASCARALVMRIGVLDDHVDAAGDANSVRMTVSAPNLTGGSGGGSIYTFLLYFAPLLDTSTLG